jgi:hypothetical protein
MLVKLEIIISIFVVLASAVKEPHINGNEKHGCKVDFGKIVVKPIHVAPIELQICQIKKEKRTKQPTGNTNKSKFYDNNFKNIYK